MPAVARIDPKTVFTPEEWSSLSRRSSWRGFALAAHAWGLIALAGAAFIAFPNPVTYVLAVMVIGARQLGLAILMHDAAHGALHPNLKLNDFIGQWLCAAAVGGDLPRYRAYHLQHHKFTEQPEDPDLSLSAPFPITRKSFWRKVLRDLSGQTFVKQRFGPSFARFTGKRKMTAQSRDVADTVALQFWVTNGVLIFATTALGYWWAWLALWIVPMATWLSLVTRLRNIAEHACVGKHDDPFRHARTTRANWLERLLIAPYDVHYHAEHHVFMHVPCWNLPKAHRLLGEKGYHDRMLIAPGYAPVLREATAKA
ncbi:MAG: fatty acid desaturase family protein [Hyphomonadaceae bacterium]|nr:fatty acid desaturase family protein [Hyphomonadaceae bacterium]